MAVQSENGLKSYLQIPAQFILNNQLRKKRSLIRTTDKLNALNNCINLRGLWQSNSEIDPRETIGYYLKSINFIIIYDLAQIPLQIPASLINIS